VAWLLQTDAPAWMFALIGILMGMPAGPIMTLPVNALAPEHRGVGMGVYFTWYYIGMAAFPPVAGAIQDATGGAAMSLAFGAALIAGTLPALAGFMLARRLLKA
jgi:MFS family permease